MAAEHVKRMVQDVLNDCGIAVSEALVDAGYDNNVGFAIIIWPLGHPEACSTCCAGTDDAARVEVSSALTAAQIKMKGRADA